MSLLGSYLSVFTAITRLTFSYISPFWVMGDRVIHMDSMQVSDRIWYQMHQAYRKGCYYSDLSFKLKTKYMWLSLFIIASPLVALALYQIGVPYKEWVIASILLIVSLLEGYIAQTNIRGDISASRVMGVQFHKLSEKWRLLWINQDRKGIEVLVDHLEDLTNHVAVEHLAARNIALNESCQEEANREFKEQFGGREAEADSQT